MFRQRGLVDRESVPGGHNVLLGYGAGDAITVGSNNTIVGSVRGHPDMHDEIVLAAGPTVRARFTDGYWYMELPRKPGPPGSLYRSWFGIVRVSR
jgi:hypothetical protein